MEHDGHASGHAERAARAWMRSWPAQDYARRLAHMDILFALALSARSLIAAYLLNRNVFVLAAVVALAMTVALLTWIGRRPLRALSLFLLCSTLLEMSLPSTHYYDDIGQYAVFFEDVSTWTHIKGLSFSLCEILLVVSLLILALRVLADRGPRLIRGALGLPVLLYLGAVLMGEAHGLASGGDQTLSLWEIQSQVYLVVAYFLAVNTLRTLSDVGQALGIVLFGTALRGVQGTYRYFFEIHGKVAVESMFPHDQSYFFVFYLVALIIFGYFGYPVRSARTARIWKRVLLLFAPFVSIALLENNRRASYIALGICIVLAIAFAAIAHPLIRTRKRALVGLVILAAIWFPYYQVYKNKTGTIAQAAHAVNSISNPDPRDASSNNYRIAESKNLLYTLTTSPIIGYGYGKHFYIVYPMVDISSGYIFWNLIPHNSILWVFMRTGFVGYGLFWLMIGAVLAQAAARARRLRDTRLRGMAVFMALLTIADIVLGYVDLQWSDGRTLIVIGVAFAILSRLDDLDTVVVDVLTVRAIRQQASISFAGDVPIIHVAHPRHAARVGLRR